MCDQGLITSSSNYSGRTVRLWCRASPTGPGRPPLPPPTSLCLQTELKGRTAQLSPTCPSWVCLRPWTHSSATSLPLILLAMPESSVLNSTIWFPGSIIRLKRILRPAIIAQSSSLKYQGSLCLLMRTIVLVIVHHMWSMELFLKHSKLDRVRVHFQASCQELRIHRKKM